MLKWKLVVFLRIVRIGQFFKFFSSTRIIRAAFLVLSAQKVRFNESQLNQISMKFPFFVQQTFNFFILK